jgi:superfamily I DNA/RNA helicase
VLFGVAGSGKTVILTARARLIAAGGPEKRVLVLCYNKVLAFDIAARFSADRALRNIEVRHFHSWAARLTGLRKGSEESFEDYESRMVATLLEGIGHIDESAKYDAILIDEAHDFEPDWLRSATGMLRNGPDSDLIVAVDGAQSLYGRPRAFTWKSVGVQAQGRSRRLSRNYRNTKQIVEFAWQVGQSLSADQGETEAHVRLVPTKAARTGPVPVYQNCKTLARERALVARLVAGYKALGLAERDIAVLYPRKEGDRIDALCRTLRESCAVAWIANDTDPKGGVRALPRPGVRLLTIHAAKGLEFPAVIVAAVDQLPNPLDPDEVRDGNLLYVALTRATDHLALCWVGQSAFTERVLRSNKAVPYSDDR